MAIGSRWLGSRAGTGATVFFRQASGFESLLSVRMKFRASDLAVAHGEDVRVRHHLHL
jgi:hypothetical protein